MSTLIFKETNCAFVVSDSADLSGWPFVDDGSNSFSVDIAFDPIIITNQIVTVPAKYITQDNGVVIQDTAGYAKQLEAEWQATLVTYTNSVQNLLDTTAQAKHYDNIISCCSYAGAPNAFQAEGQAAIEWRGNVWATCYSIMAQVQAGTIPAPTIPELLAMLPVMVWP